ncbi:MAG: FkbM family methyltransferase, partial [Chryseobacterium sp.]
RKLFKGQFRLFLWLFGKNFLPRKKTITKPFIGNFKINVDTKNFIDACIYFTGDYEPYLKTNFADLIKPGMVILDVGANIGFHTLYFAELTGKSGKVVAFEPIDVNFKALQQNLALNEFPHIMPVNKALGSENSTLHIHIDVNAHNPGAFNLFENGKKNTSINCVRADDFLKESQISKVDFIKVDVEGFELEVFKGLAKTLKQSHPIIFFEYDVNYQLKSQVDPKEIFYFLSEFAYDFYTIDGYGNRKKLQLDASFGSAEILALPSKQY